MKQIPWIVVTGLDGSGKTTLVDNLEKHFTSLGLRVLRTRSPHDKYLVKDLLNVSGDGEPMKDRYTDRLIFALDNRILGTRIRQWERSGEYDLILSQRGFFDSFVHGAVQGYSYREIADLNHIEDLPRCTVMIHLCADSAVAYARISGDPDADKFETPAYMRRQEAETRRGYRELKKHENPDLSAFDGTKNYFIDTTELSTCETFELAKKRLSPEFLATLLPSIPNQ